MNATDLALLRSPVLLAARQSHMRALEGLFGGRTGRHVMVLQGINGGGRGDPYAEPEQWVDEALADLAASAEALSDPHVFRPLIVEFGPYGVHFVDRIFGARVFRHADQWWVEHLAGPVGQLRPPDLEADPTWLLARRLASAFVRSGVTVPFFAAATIASPLNVLVNLYGERALTAMLEQPDAVRHDLALIARVQAAMHQWYRETVPAEQLQLVAAGGRTQPGGSGQICGCTTQLLSAGLYADLVAPWDDALLALYPRGGMIHLCGGHRAHLPVWQAMRSLRAVQLNDRAAEDLQHYVEGLREDQLIYLNLTETMTVERAVAITGGHRLVLVAPVPEPIPTRPA